MSKMIANVLRHITFGEKIKNKVNIFYYNYFSKSYKNYMIFYGCILVYNNNNLEKLIFLFWENDRIKKYILVI